MEEFIPLCDLEKRGYARIVCYPNVDSDELGRRLFEMKKLGVKSLSFRGDKKVDNIRVLGKGYVGIVVLVQTKLGLAALKVRRIDSGRTGMRHEAEILAKANTISVGPKLLGCSQNLLLMEYIDGLPFPKWIEALNDTKKARLYMKKVLKEILEQCWRLDEAGIDHGELSNAQKHIIVCRESRVCVLDFESASVKRRVSNVTSICHYLFVKSSIVETIRRRVANVDSSSLIEALRKYKENRVRENFKGILKICLF